MPMLPIVLALKANHPTLHRQVKTWFEQAQALNFEGINFSYNEGVEKGQIAFEMRLPCYGNASAYNELSLTLPGLDQSMYGTPLATVFDNLTC